MLTYTASQNSHSTAFATGRPADGAFALYAALHADKAALLPPHIPFTSGAVLPFAIEAAVSALSVRESSPCMPGVTTPALRLPYPSLHPSSPTKLLIVNGASSSVGSTTTQIAAAAGIAVLAITSTRHFDLATQSGARAIFDRPSRSRVDDVGPAVGRDLRRDLPAGELRVRSRDFARARRGRRPSCVHAPAADGGRAGGC